MRKTPKNTAGFTFVESIITFSIVGILLALTWATVNFLMIKTNDQIVRTRAHFLAMEGIEIVKQIRQTAVNRNRETGFADSIGRKEAEKAYAITTISGGGFKLEEANADIIKIEMNEEPFIDYCRTIIFEGTGESVRQVKSTVRWGGVDCETGENMLSYSTILADLTQ